MSHYTDYSVRGSSLHSDKFPNSSWSRNDTLRRCPINLALPRMVDAKEVRSTDQIASRGRCRCSCKMAVHSRIDSHRRDRVYIAIKLKLDHRGSKMPTSSGKRSASHSSECVKRFGRHHIPFSKSGVIQNVWQHKVTPINSTSFCDEIQMRGLVPPLLEEHR